MTPQQGLVMGVLLALFLTITPGVCLSSLNTGILANGKHSTLINKIKTSKRKINNFNIKQSSSRKSDNNNHHSLKWLNYGRFYNNMFCILKGRLKNNRRDAERPGLIVLILDENRAVRCLVWVGFYGLIWYISGSFGMHIFIKYILFKG